MSVLRSVSIRSFLSWRNRASISAFVGPAAPATEAPPSPPPSTPPPPASTTPPPLPPPAATEAQTAADSFTSSDGNLPSYWPRLSCSTASARRFSVTRCSSP